MVEKLTSVGSIPTLTSNNKNYGLYTIQNNIYDYHSIACSLDFAKENPNWNLKGGESMDENTITTKRNKAY